MQSLTIIALAAGTIALPAPLSDAATIALALFALFLCWTRKKALERCAQGVSAQLDEELGELIAEAYRRHEATHTD